MRGGLSPADDGNGGRPLASFAGAVAKGLPGEPVKVAFYGRANRRGPQAATEVARQLALCRAVSGAQSEITRVFSDSPEPAASRSPVPDGGGPPWEGGWDALATAMTAPPATRGFAAVICMAAHSMSRCAQVLAAREAFAERHGVPVLYADELTEPSVRHLLVRQVRRSPVSTPSGTVGLTARTMTGTARQLRAGTSRRALRRGRQMTG
jgi:hypothetical protein